MVTKPTSGEHLPGGRLTTARRKSLALDLLSRGHTLAHVKKVLGINRVTMYRWRQDDPSFAQAYSDAMEAGTDLIEQEARRRAVEGYDRPVYQRGRMVGVVRCIRMSWRPCRSEAGDPKSIAKRKARARPRLQ